MSEFESKTVLVTGGSSGIGRAIAVAFAKKGANVVVSSRREKEGEETVRLVNEAGGVGHFARADVSKSEDIRAMVREAVSQFGALHFAVNNAGIEGEVFVPTAEFKEEEWDRVIATNLTGVYLSMKYEIPELLKQGGGAIVNLSSVAGLRGGQLSVAYMSSKHGVIGATKAVASEYAEQGIRVNAVCPAVIETDMAGRAGFLEEGTDMYEQVKGMHPLGRFGRPAEVADAVVWLCSQQSSFVTGHALPVDGGFLL